MPAIQHGSECSEPTQGDIGAGHAADLSTVPVPNDGDQTVASMLPSNRVRWVARRKAEVVEAVRRGILTLDEARERYDLSIEEFLAWQHGIGLFGLAGLQVYGTQGRERIRTPPADSESEARMHHNAAHNATKSG